MQIPILQEQRNHERLFVRPLMGAPIKQPFHEMSQLGIFKQPIRSQMVPIPSLSEHKISLEIFQPEQPLPSILIHPSEMPRLLYIHDNEKPSI